MCVWWAFQSPSILVQVKCRRETFHMPTSISSSPVCFFLGCTQNVGGWKNSSCHRHLEKPTWKAASAEVTLVSVLLHNTGPVLCQIHWQLLGEKICVTTYLLFPSSGERRATLEAVPFASSIIFSTILLYFATVNWSSGCCKNFGSLKNSNRDMYIAKLILPALTWRGMLSTITCGRVMTVLTTGTLSTGELLQEKVKYRPCWILCYIKHQVSIQTEYKILGPKPRQCLLQENTKLFCLFLHFSPLPKKPKIQQPTIIPKNKSAYFLSLSRPRDVYLFQEII